MGLDWSSIPAVVSGGLIAAGAGWVQSIRSRNERRQQFADEIRQRRTDDIWSRSYERAQEIIAALDDVGRVALKPGRVALTFMPDDETERSEVKAALDRIRAASIYLPQPTRTRAEDFVRLVPRLGELLETGYIQDWPRFAGRNAIEATREVLGRYLRQEDPGEFSADMSAYLKALGELNEAQEVEIKRQIAGYSAREALERDAQ